MIKENSVAIFYHCDYPSDKLTANRSKLQHRLKHAIEDMAEDGFTNFILPLDERSPFPTIFIDALNAAKAKSSNIRLTIMLPYEIEEPFADSPAERLRVYTQHADETIYNQKIFDIETLTNQTTNLLAKASALIIYFECSCSKLYFITQHAQRNRIPFVNINI